MTTLKEKQMKIQRYETFLNETLREDLRKVSILEENVLHQLTGYGDLRMFIQSLQNDSFKSKDKPLKTKVDLGCNFYANAEISNTDMIVLSVGLNFYVELKLNEALKFIEKKEKALEMELEQLTRKSCKIKANIKMVMEGLRELQGIPAENPKKRTPLGI